MSMNTLIINCGSSSLGFGVYEVEAVGGRRVVAAGKAKNVATATQAASVVEWSIGGQSGQTPAVMETHRAAAQEVLKLLRDHGVTVDAVGHRFVHGGDLFTSTTKIDDQTLAGKAVTGVTRLARDRRVPVVAVCGADLLGPARAAALGLAGVYALSALEPDPVRSITGARELVRRTAARIARERLPVGTP
jgi:hypothetical protein